MDSRRRLIIPVCIAVMLSPVSVSPCYRCQILVTFVSSALNACNWISARPNHNHPHLDVLRALVIDPRHHLRIHPFNPVQRLENELYLPTQTFSSIGRNTFPTCCRLRFQRMLILETGSPLLSPSRRLTSSPCI